MNNLILFVNQFLSYIVLMLIIVVVATAGFFVGSIIRKSRDKKKSQNPVSAED